jgi:hypothetical protein
MPITTPDFVLRLSGGAANTDPDASLGGAKSSTVVSAAVNGLFDPVGAAEAAAGDVEYRCIYVHNANGADTMTALVAFVQSDTTSAQTALAIGVGASAVNGTEDAAANESTAPAGVTFSAPVDAGSGIALGNIPPGQHRALWVRWTVSAGAGATSSDAASLGLRCETV